MSDRYTQLFALSKDLYIDGSPVVISAGALLKDNDKDSVLVQLKIKNICRKVIKAVTVKIIPMDSAGRDLGEKIEHKFLDISAKRNDEFAQKEPVYLSDNSTRAFSVYVSEVIFDDNSIWSCEDSGWETLPDEEIRFADSELLKQYKMTYGAYAGKQPVYMNSIWKCTCGYINSSDEEKCQNCSIEIGKLKGFDMEQLKADCSARLEKEELARQEAKKKAEEEQKEKAERERERQRLEAERKEAEKKRNKKIAISAVAAAVCIIVGGIKTAVYLDHNYVIGAYDEVKGAGKTSLSQVLDKFDGHNVDFNDEISAFVSQVKELDKMSGKYEVKYEDYTFTFSMDLYLKNGSFYAKPHTDLYNGLYGGVVYEAEIVPIDGEYKYQTNPQGEHHDLKGAVKTYFDIKVNENTVRFEWSKDESDLGKEYNTYHILTR